MILDTSSSHGRDCLSITLICGFLGSGKTNLLQHIIHEYQGGALAFILMDSSEFNFDEGVIRGLCRTLHRNNDLVVGIQDDSGSPRWQEVLPDIVRDCAASGNYERLFIEVSGKLDKQSVLKTLPAAEPSLVTHGLQARVDEVLCVLNAAQIQQELLSTSENSVSINQNPMSKMLVSQVRGAHRLLLQQSEQVAPEIVEKIWEFFQLINPTAHCFDFDQGGVPQDLLAAPDQENQGAPAMIFRSTKPQNFETTILSPTFAKSFLYTARRPFHPARFMEVFSQQWPSSIIRAKGFFWLASRMNFVGGLSQAGAFFSCSVAGEWWAAIPEEYRPTSGFAFNTMKEKWKEPFGDRRQEIVLLGQGLFQEKVQELLDSCLLSNEEMAQGPLVWQEYEDPFLDWTEVD